MDKLSLEPILEYHMPALHAKAYKVGLIWLVLSRKHFPNYKHTRGYPVKGDPRNSSLFKHCLRLVKDTLGLIDDREYKLYIQAQINVLKAINMGGRHPAIEPSALIGDKAWVRWKLWKKKYDKVAKQGHTKEEVGLDIIPFQSVCKELDSTKKFLIGQFEKLPEEETIITAAKNIERWIALGKVSGFYALLCPWIKKHCKLTTDLTLYEKSVTPQVRDYFQKLFS